MNLVMMCRLLELVVAIGMVVVVVVSASNSEPTLQVQSNSYQSAIHTSAKGKGSSIREAELDITRPAPKVSYPPPPGNIGLQQAPVISSDSLMGMVLKRYEEIVEALLSDRFHLRGLDNLSIVKPPKPKLRPAPKGYPPSPKSPLVANNKARPAPRGYPPSPKTPLADVYQEQYNQAKINGLERM